MNGQPLEHRQRPRGTAKLIVFGFSVLFAFGGLVMLGIWQIERRAWKLDLIERVESRIHAAPVAAPAPAEWPLITAARDEYKHVRVYGFFLSGKDTRVQALTALGAGFWLLSPFQTDDGSIVLINRGFVPPDWPAETRAPADTSVTGLLRLSETKGGFLRTNEPAAERWYSRDIAAIAAARGLQNVAPFFVDKEGDAKESLDKEGFDTRTFPRGGLTVIRFPNSHLGYALTWFALALMVAAAGAYVAREEYRLRRAPQQRSTDAG
ncbi:MAG: SURF1 family protein [Spongiibacteraceae bacterium]